VSIIRGGEDEDGKWEGKRTDYPDNGRNRGVKRVIRRERGRCDY